MRAARALFLASSVLAVAPLSAEPLARACNGVTCEVRLTADQMLAQASMLVQQRRFDEARPIVAALTAVPSLGMESHFLSGMIAVETGELKAAISQFRASLAIDPKQTRVRLELARALMLDHQNGASIYHFRLAGQDSALTPDIRATIQQARGILRDSKPWHLNTNFGFAPDSNINNGTQAQTVDVVVGDQILPLTLDQNARARSGIGATGSLSAGYRFTLGERTGFLLDADGQGVKYKGSAADDYTLQLAAGPEFRPTEATSIGVQAVGLQRWYGGARAVTQAGARLTVQHTLDDAQRVGLSLDARHSASGFSDNYSGWNLALYATYERVVARSMIASASLFVRADMLNSGAYSNHELGMSLGIGGELGHGINAGVTGTLSRAVFDAPLLALSDSARRDWRYSARVYAGLRSFRLMGFSPSVSYTYSANDASLPLYASRRSRFAFDLARYF